MPTTLLYRTVLLALSGLLALTSRRTHTGLRHVPATGGALVVCNHISLADPPVLLDALRRTGRLPRALATAGLFAAPVFGRLLHALGYIPVLRGTSSAAAALAPAVAALDAGELVVLYPEGGISRGDQWPMPGKTGAARLALATGVPVVPVAQWGAQRVLPPWTRFGYLRPFAALLTRPRVVVSVGEPLHLAGDPDDPAAVLAATAAVMAAIETQLATLRGPRPAADLATAPAADRAA